MALTPWREVVTPHPDVAAGRYNQTEFAADLAAVLAGDADPEYQDPKEFFARTYLTDGMQQLLVSTVQRTSGKGGAPIVQLKTAFGGGKTHTMLALFHLVDRNASIDQMEGTESIIGDAGVSELPHARLAVIAGTSLNPTETRQVNGITVRTLWGDIAAQLGGQKGYEIVRTADEKGVAPGANDLVTVFNQFGPAVILIDELIAYARNFYGVSGLPAGSFDSNMTFVQSLTEAVKRSGQSQLVATIPESDIEIGGEGGQAALERVEHTFGRLEDIWRPVAAREGFEIVRRRLFSPVKDKAMRDKVCREFMQLYVENPSDFPAECREAAYLNRIRQAYPIHPELFDRLYDDWSTLERFQRTRGVLRLMSAVIHRLWDSDDRSGLILPGSIPLDAPRVREEPLRYLPEGWNAVVDNDVDGVGAAPRSIDGDNPRFGAISASRRVARAIFMGSAPHVHQQTVRGIEDVRIRLGVAQPGESVAVFNDAIGRLVNRLTHLYTSSGRYWYDTRPNLRRTMEDRAVNMEPEAVEAEIVRRLRQFQRRGDFSAVHPCPSSVDVPDEPHARLVVLSPKTAYRATESNSSAHVAATEILDKRGDIPRGYRNMLIFVAPDVDTVAPLESEARRFLAWDSIVQEADALNLDAHQRREAGRGKTRSNETVDMRLKEAYCWLLVPTQDGTAPIKWEATRMPGSQDDPVKKAFQKVRSDEQLIREWSPTLLKMELDRWLWKEEPHVSLKRVWECLATYLYLPRLRNSDVLLVTVREGIRTLEFGYANGVQDDGKYAGLQFGGPNLSIYLDDQSVLVKPDVAQKQLEADAEHTTPPQHPPSEPKKKESSGKYTSGKGDEADPPQGANPKRFYGTVNLDPMRVARDTQQIIEEVVQHLTSLPNATVVVTMDIQAVNSDGFPKDTVNTVKANCETLKFSSEGFEEE